MTLDPGDVQARAEALVGQVLGGRYRLDAVLGIGAMGAVYRAYHTGLERAVAVKLLHRDLMNSDEMRARFSREAAAISKLDHPNCVRVTDFGNEDEHQYLVMELLQGTTLGHELDEPLPPLRAIELLDEVLAGLEHAHGHGLVHRDVKPENVFLARDGAKTRAKLLDFGIVKLQEGAGGRQLTQMGMIFGTPHFMSPEQAQGSETDARTDLYATGVILYEMLAGHLPFDGDDPIKVLRQQIRDEPPPLPSSVPDPLRGLVARLLAKKPDDRYPSATAVREALAGIRTALQPAPVEIPAPAPPPPTAAAVTPVMVPPRATGPAWWPPSKAMKLAAAGVGGLALVIAIAVAAGGDDEAPAQSPEAPAEAARAGLEALLGKANASDEGETKAEPAAEDGGEAGDVVVVDDATGGEKALQASLASVDALIEARQHEAARIMLGPLLQAHAEVAALHWRMGKVLTALGGADNRAAALESYAAAIRAEATVLDDQAFMEELSKLLDDPKLREPAVELAIELLGTRIDDELLGWLNVQAKPLGYALRHRTIAHLEGHGRGDDVNRPLQRALDLWQASEADDPCAAFGRALDEAQAHPDSFLLGTLQHAPVPDAKAGPGEEPQACSGAADQLAKVRTEHEESYAGIDPVVPRAYRSRSSSQSSRKRRR